MAKLRAAVVGVGYLGRFHAQKYKNNTAVDLIGVCDGFAEQAQKVAAELGVRAFHNAKELIGQVDLVTIAANTQSHYELALLFLQNGIHVNVEKPITATISQAQEIVQLAQAKNLKLSVGHIERFNPAIIEFKKHLTTWSYLELTRHTPFRARGADVSVLHDLMIHDLDLMFWLAGQGGQIISATGEKLISQSYDTADVIYRFPGNRLVRLSASRVSAQPIRSIRAVDSHKTLFANTGTLALESVEPIALTAAEPLKINQWTAEKTDALQVETDTFIHCVQNNIAPSLTGEDGLRALQAVEEIITKIGG